MGCHMVPSLHFLPDATPWRPLCSLPSFLTWCHNMASTQLPSFLLTSYFPQLFLLPNCQEIIRSEGRNMVSALFPSFISYLVPQHGVRIIPILTTYLVFSPTVSHPWLPWFSPRNHPFETGATWCPLCSSLNFLPGATSWRSLCSHPSTYLVFSPTNSPP